MLLAPLIHVPGNALGGGGFLLVYCPPSARESVLAAMDRYRQMPFLFELDGSKVIFNYRRPSWK